MTSAIFAKRLVPANAVPAVAGLCAILVTAEFQYEVWAAPDAVGLAYVLLIMLTAGPMILDPLVQTIVGLLSLAGYVVIASRALDVLTPHHLPDWLLVGLAAELIGTLLMAMRLRAIDELGSSRLLIQELATHDALTGVFNRHGMLDALDRVQHANAQQRSRVQVRFVDIDWLKTANDTHGHEFGDTVIRAVASAVMECAAPDHTVARWGGDEFLVLGTADDVSDDAFEQKLQSCLQRSDLDLAKWPGTVSVGSAQSTLEDIGIFKLIRIADEKMYERRRARRASAD